MVSLIPEAPCSSCGESNIEKERLIFTQDTTLKIGYFGDIF